MGRYTDNAINLAKKGLKKIGKNSNGFKRKVLIHIGIGIMSAIAFGTFVRGLVD